MSSQNPTLPNIPELFNPNFLDVLVPGSPIGDAMVVDNVQPPTNPLMTALINDNRAYTQNMGHALSSTGSATLDAFNGLNASSFKEVNGYLENSWKEDPVITLRLIWNIRSIQDGKAEKELFYRAFGWLYDNHPRTALSNLHMIVSPSCTTPKDKDNARPHGYWKDLLNILALATLGQLSNLTAQSTFLHNYIKRKRRRYSDKPKSRKTPEEVKEANERELMHAREKRKELHRQYHAILTSKLENDPKYRALYIMVARMFAKQLRKDLKVMDELNAVNSKEDKQRWYTLSKSISLAGKWAPTPSGSHDSVTNISTAICQLLFSPSENSGPDAIGPLPSGAPYPIPDDAENCSILRSFYGRWILKPLREVICCPEPLMTAQRWTEIQYSRVPSICMSINKAGFIKHDPNGFEQFMVDVEKGKRRVSGATLMPHELVGEAYRLNDEILDAWESEFPLVAEFKKNAAELELRVIDAQWRTLIERLRESGSLDNSIAVCDVSGSMGDLDNFNKKRVSPIFPAIGLSLVLAHLSKPPFNAGFIPFSANPQFVRLQNMEEAGLASLVETMSDVEWGMNTNFQAVFLDLLLPLAKKHNVPKEDMIKRIFVFSDMQFDEAQPELNTTKEWETNHDRVEQAYTEAGYDVPEIVYWNLSWRCTVGKTVEVEGDRKGVAMMSGFSAAMMKVFMGDVQEGEEEAWAEVTKDGNVVDNKEDKMTPLNFMKKALFQESFDGLVVVD